VSRPSAPPGRPRSLPALLTLVVAAVAVTLVAAGIGRSDDHAAKPAAAKGRAPAPLPYQVPEAPADEKLPAPSAFVAPGGDDSGGCDRGHPCSTFDRAYQAAQPGDVVEVAAGSYPEQILPYDATRISDRDVTFRPAPGAAVKLAGLTFGHWTDDRGAAHVQVRDMDVGEIMARRAEDLTFRNLTMRSFWVEGGRDLRFLGGSVGGIKGANPWLGTWRGNDGSTQTPKDVVIEGVDFHDVRMQKASDHIECLHVNDVDGLVVRNNRFHDCDTFDMLVMYGYNEELRDILVEGNDFASTGNSFGGPSYFGLSLRFGHNVTVRHNTSPAPWAGPDAGGGAITGAWTVEHNTFPGLQSCPGGITFRGNTWTGKHAEACGPTDRVAP
jgi:hypothetical protein